MAMETLPLMDVDSMRSSANTERSKADRSTEIETKRSPEGKPEASRETPKEDFQGHLERQDGPEQVDAIEAEAPAPASTTPNAPKPGALVVAGAVLLADQRPAIPEAVPLTLENLDAASPGLKAVVPALSDLTAIDDPTTAAAGITGPTGTGGTGDGDTSSVAQGAGPLLMPTAGATDAEATPTGESGSLLGLAAQTGAAPEANLGLAATSDGAQIAANPGTAAGASRFGQQLAPQARQAASTETAAPIAIAIEGNATDDLTEVQTVTQGRAAAALGDAPHTLQTTEMRASVEANAADRAVSAQVARAALSQIANGQRVLTLRLTPPELGTVRIQVIEQNGALSVRMSAEDDGVRAAIERALPSLRQELRQADAPIAELSLVDHDQSMLHDGGREAGDGNGDNNNSQRSGFSLNGETEPESRATSPRNALGGSIGPNAVDARA
ncbi:MAG: flagellar hook-length control protein FliK [Planctomycetota bacterium]|jgi:flagellar hook-length control protein FliK|nr:flagellar hook-length control protein FliK [Planctomycetota bacterium]